MTRLIQSIAETRPGEFIPLDLNQQNKFIETLKTQNHDTHTNYYAKPGYFCYTVKQYNKGPGD
jgi:hypothetical protein